MIAPRSHARACQRRLSASVLGALRVLGIVAIAFMAQACREDARVRDRSALPAFPHEKASVRIRGKVAWAKRSALPRSRPIPIPTASAPEIPNPKWQVDAQARGVPNAFVEVLGVESRWRFAPTTEVARLEQAGHRYRPWSIFVRTGQLLEVTNREEVLHNLKWTGRKNGNSNRNLAKGESAQLRFEHPEEIHFRCDVQNWMEAWAYVREHPFGVITSEDGSFELPSLPPGTYELRVQHPNPSWHGEARRVELRQGADTVLTLTVGAEE